jgi:prepilin-type N-terminal cleavage/methylation domain-containing protein
MKHQETAFSLVELIIVVMLLCICAVIAIPRFNYALISKQKADVTARKIVTDLRLTRRLAISDAANNTMGYELKMAGPIPYRTYEIENIKTTATVASHTVDSSVTLGTPTGIRFMFGPLGNLNAGSAIQINVSAEGKSFAITINSATGTIKCVEN